MKRFSIRLFIITGTALFIALILPLFLPQERRSDCVFQLRPEKITSCPGKNSPKNFAAVISSHFYHQIIASHQKYSQANVVFAQENLTAEMTLSENKLISIDVKDVEMKDIARMMSRVSGLNIVVSDAVQQKVTLRVNNVKWEDALNIILKTYNITSVREGDFLRIVTYRELREEEEGVPLETKVVFLNFAKVEPIKETLTPLLSSRGKISIDIKSNCLIITDIPEYTKKLINVVKKLDKRTPQVLIEALMLDIKLTEGDKFGVQWYAYDKKKAEDWDYTNDKYMMQNLSSSSVEGMIQFGKPAYKNLELIGLIDFLRQNMKAEVLANPKVMTLDGLKAKIELVEQVPFVQSTISSDTGAITSTVTFKEVGIILEVTPTISAEGFVSLVIKTEQSFRTGVIGGQPIIDSRKAETNLLVKSSETIVIGGLRKKSKTETIDKFPLLGDLPIIGKAFQRKIMDTADTELLLFVTPYIIAEAQLTPQEETNIRKFDGLRDERQDILEGKFEKEEPFPLRPLK